MLTLKLIIEKSYFQDVFVKINNYIY